MDGEECEAVVSVFTPLNSCDHGGSPGGLKNYGND